MLKEEKTAGELTDMEKVYRSQGDEGQVKTSIVEHARWKNKRLWLEGGMSESVISKWDDSRCWQAPSCAQRGGW